MKITPLAALLLLLVLAIGGLSLRWVVNGQMTEALLCLVVVLLIPLNLSLLGVRRRGST